MLPDAGRYVRSISLAGLAAAWLVLGFTSHCVAQERVGKLHLSLDPSATEVQFTLKDTLHTVRGSFHLKSGDIVFDPQSGEAKGLIAVDAGSGVSGNDTRDGRMKKEFLEVTSFPVATFEPQKVTGFDAKAASQTIQVMGSFTLHGAAHPLTLQFTVTTSSGTTAVAAATHFNIPYVAWGIKDPSIPFVKVEKEVALDVIAKGTLSPEN